MSGNMTGGVDSSIPLRAGQGVGAPLNPLDQIGKFATIQNALNQNTLFPQILAQQKQKTLNEQQSASFGLLAPMLALPPDQWTHAMITDLAAKGEARGYVTHPIMAHLGSAPSGDGAQLAAVMRPLIASQMQTEAGARMAAVTGSPALLDTGQGTQPGLVEPPGSVNQGAFTPRGGSVERYPSRETLMGTTKRPATAEEAARLGVPPGTEISVPIPLQAAQNGTAPLTGPAGRNLLPGQPPLINVPGRGNQIAPNFDPVTGQPLTYSTTPPPMPPGARPVRPGQLGGDVGPAPPLSAKDAATVAGFKTGGMTPFVSKPPAGMVESQETSAKAYDAALINDSQFQRRTFPLREAMNSLGRTSTGPGTETSNYIKSFLQARAPETYKKLVGQEGSDKIKNYDLSVKYLADWVAQQGGSQRSDMAQTLASTSSPSTHISQAAARQVLAAALGLENMQHAAATEFTKTQGGQANGGQFLSWMNQNFTPNADPHGYAWGSIPRDTRAEILKGASPEEKKRLYDSYKRAVDLNLTPAIK